MYAPFAWDLSHRELGGRWKYARRKEMGWLSRFPVYVGRVLTASANLTMSGLSLNARGCTSASAGSDATVEAQIEAIERTQAS